MNRQLADSHEATLHWEMSASTWRQPYPHRLIWYWQCTCGDEWTKRSTFRGARDAATAHETEHAT